MGQAMKQSTFVTVVAWLALIFSGFSAAIGVLQSILVLLSLPIQPMAATEAADVPAVIRVLFDNFHWFVISFTVFWCATFIVSVGLLRRREWGRQGFVAMLVLASIGTTIVAVLQQTLFTTAVPADAGAAMIVMRIVSAAFAVVFVGVFVWLAVRLCSEGIRAEFNPPPNQPLQPASGAGPVR